MMVMAESAGADPDMRELYDGGVVAKRRDQRTVAQTLAELGALRDGVDVDRARPTPSGPLGVVLEPGAIAS